MKRIAIFMLLVALSVSGSIPVQAQGTGAAEYARRSGKANKKAAKEQRKVWKKYVKARRQEIKKSNRRTRYRTSASGRLPH
jgi:hypothetical protein